MATWLDEYVFQECCNRRRAVSGPRIDIERALAAMASDALKVCEDPRTSYEERVESQFTADFLPFVADELRGRSRAFGLTPSFVASVGQREPTLREIAALNPHTSTCPFTYLDLPRGTFPLGGDVEFKAIFIRSGKVVNSKQPAIRAADQTVFDCVIGFEGRFTTQRLRWTKSGNGWTIETTEDNMSECPMTLLNMAGANSAIFDRVTVVAASAIAYANANAGKPGVRKLPFLPLGDPARMKCARDYGRTIFDILEIGGVKQGPAASRNVAFSN